jgi:hypothetical protein
MVRTWFGRRAGGIVDGDQGGGDQGGRNAEEQEVGRTEGHRDPPKGLQK